MLLHYFHQIGNILLSVEYFAFPVSNVFLEIKSRRFRDTEVFKLFYITDSHLSTNPEKMIGSMATG